MSLKVCILEQFDSCLDKLESGKKVEGVFLINKKTPSAISITTALHQTVPAYTTTQPENESAHQ